MKAVIVGGGVIGCATAWELARAGVEVTLLERGVPGSEASSAAAGMLAPLGETAASGFRALALASWRLYPGLVADLRSATGIDVEHVTRGTIYPIQTLADARDAEGWALDPEFGAEVLDARELHAREPALSPKIRSAIFVRGDQWINNQRLIVALANAAAAAGADIRTACPVSRLLVEEGRAQGVVGDGERFEADVVLLAAGAWTPELTAELGAVLPVEPRRGQMVALAHVPPVLTHCVHGDVYLVPRPSGELLLGATVEKAGFHRTVTAEGVAWLLRGAIELVPSLATLPLTRTWCGFRPWAPDALPILGPWPGVPGLWVATAHFRNGILLAPITARLMCEWIVDGRPSVDVKDFLPDRFLIPGQGRRP